MKTQVKWLLFVLALVVILVMRPSFLHVEVQTPVPGSVEIEIRGDDARPVLNATGETGPDP